MYDRSPYVEPLGYQPVEFLDIASMSEDTDVAHAHPPNGQSDNSQSHDVGATVLALNAVDAPFAKVQEHRTFRVQEVRSPPRQTNGERSDSHSQPTDFDAYIPVRVTDSPRPDGSILVYLLDGTAFVVNSRSVRYPDRKKGLSPVRPPTI